MKKLVFAVLAFVLIVAPVHVASAEEAHDHDDERVAHYAAQNIENDAQALKALSDNQKAISEILEAENLSDSELEQIHEISYTLEAAIDKLISSKFASEETLSEIDDAIQAIHYASEDHDEEKLRAWFAKLEPAAGKIE